MSKNDQNIIKQALENEREKMYTWFHEEQERIEREAREKGLWMDSGLDSNEWLFKELYNEVRVRLKAIREKYGLDE